MVNVNTVNISIYDLATSVASGWTTIGVFSTPNVSGTFTELTTSGTRITLVSTTEYYQYIHTSASDISNVYYKCKLFNVSGVAKTTFETTNAFKGNTSDLTEDLRNMINDTADSIANYRYTIKELRRFVYMACNSLQQTKYRRRFKADYNGIISPAVTSMDKGIVLLQAHLTLATSQLLKAADTYIVYSDGQGKMDNRTSVALKQVIKYLKDERNELIDDYNKVLGNKTTRIELLGINS